MPVTHSCLISSAQKIMSCENINEADLRAAMSRSYYGAYHCAKSFAESHLNISLDNYGGGVHKKLSVLLAQYRNEDTKTSSDVKRIGARLQILHSLRCRADYDLNDEICMADATSLLRQASEVAASIEKMRADTPT